MPRGRQLEYLLLSVITIAASFVLGMTGFGFAIFLMGFFPMIIGVKSSSVLVTTVGLAVIIYLLIPLIRYTIAKSLGHWRADLFHCQLPHHLVRQEWSGATRSGQK